MSLNNVRGIFGVLSLVAVLLVSSILYAEPPSTESSIQLVTPLEGAFLKGVIPLEATLHAAEAIDFVSFYSGDTLISSDSDHPYSIDWDTTQEADGPHTLVVRATGKDFIELSSPRVSVTIDNTPPTATLREPEDDGTVMGLITLEATAQDILGVSLMKFLVDGKAIETRTDPPFDYSWDTEAYSNGPHAIQVRVIDHAGNYYTTPPIGVVIENVNRPPLLKTIGSKTVAEGNLLTFTIGAIDPEGDRDPLVFTVNQLPPWATFDPETQVFSGTPDHEIASVLDPSVVYSNIIFQVCDVEPLCDREGISISVVDSNRPPDVDVEGELVLSEGERVNVTLIVTDPDGDPVTCAAAFIPKWLTFVDSVERRGVKIKELLA